MDPNPSTWFGIPTTVMSTIGTILAAFIALSAPILTIWLTHLRPSVKQTVILDFATKRIAFWDQFRKAGLDAIDPNDQTQQDQVRQKAYQGIEQALNDANQQIKVLSWKQKRNQDIQQQFEQRKLRFLFVFRPPHSFSLFDKYGWYTWIIYSWLGAIAFVCLSVWVFWLINIGPGPLQPDRAWRILWRFAALLFLVMIWTRWTRIQAEKLKYKRPPDVVIDHI